MPDYPQIATQRKRGLLVLVGAGASYDCGDESGAYDPAYRPPLTAQLFSQPAFLDVLKKYGDVAALAPRIRGRLDREPLEQVLAEFFHSPASRVREMAREVPLYLQEVLGLVSERFAKAGGTRFDTLVREVASANFDTVCYVTTNYDTFLEQALGRYFRCEFKGMVDYCRPGREWCLVKLHGSVNWGKQLLNGRATIEPFQIKCDGTEPALGELNVMTGYCGQSRFQRQQFFYPALAAPITGKEDIVCPDSHLEHMQRELPHCETVLVLGFSGADAHVLKLLHTSANVRRMAIANMGMKPESETLGRFHQIAWPNVRFLPEDACAKSGFARFDSSGKLRAFLQAQ